MIPFTMDQPVQEWMSGREEERLTVIQVREGSGQNQDVSNGERKLEGFKKYFADKSIKLGNGLGQGENDEVCKYVKNACYILGLNQTHKK